MLTKRFILLLLITAFSATTANAEPNLQPILEKNRQEHALPALGAVLIVDGEVGEPCVIGQAGMGLPVQVPADARWHLGSCGKSMTAFLTAVMVEKDLLRWDTTLADAFADTDIQLHEGFKDVTIDQLLRHRGGLSGELLQLPIWGQLRLQGGPATEQRRLIAETCLGTQPAYEPGSEFKYANEGYAIVGYILELKTGKPYEDLMAEHVFGPLGLTTAGFGPPPGETDPRGHLGKMPLPPHRMADNPEGLSPAGRVHMSLADWARYAQAHLKAARGEAFELLSEASYQYMQTPLEDQHYALGWGCPERDWAAGRTLAHAGSNTMWRAEIWIAPYRNAALLIATNMGSDNAKDALNDALKSIIESRWPEE